MKAGDLLTAIAVATVGCQETRQNDGGASAQQSAGTTNEERADSADWKAVDQAMGR